MYAAPGFIGQNHQPPLSVEIPEDLFARIPEGLQAALQGVLAQDPRPSYQHKPGRVYGLNFAGFDIRFTVEENQLIVHEVTAEKVI